MKKIKIPSEAAYILALLIISFSIAMVTASDLGLSMIAAPAYILSVKLGFLSFGQCEYVIQGTLFVLLCLLTRRFKPLYLFSFLTGVIYGFFLDCWRMIIPAFNPELTAPGSMAMPLRIFYFVASLLLTALAIALFFRTYIYPQVYEFFVKGVAAHFHLNRDKFKIGFDFSFLALSVIMSWGLCHTWVGIGLGTIVTTCVNGLLIGAMGKLIEKFFVFEPALKKFAAKFE